MITVLVLFIVAYALARIGLALIRVGQEESFTPEEEEASRVRMIKFSTWLKGNGRKADIFPKECLDSKHLPMVLFNKENPTKVDSVICRFCTDTLPMPASLTCDECWVIAVDGYLHIEACDKHNEEPALL